MVTNLRRYLSFMRSTKDVLSTGKSAVTAWKLTGLLLLVFFLVGYILTATIGSPDIIMAGILFGGSIFVAIMLTLLFQLIVSVKTNCLAMTETLIGVIEARDPNLNGHSRYVQNLTMLFYEYLPNDMKKSINPVSLEYAALMHDVGKLGIPEKILNKPAPLTADEWQIMRTHPQLGAAFIEPLPSFRHIIPWIKYHHERIDGTGYYRLSAEEIPLAAKIISIADTYSAITMRRAYKEPKTHEYAMNVMLDAAGTQLDTQLVNIFCKIPKERLIACAPAMLTR